MHAYFITLAKLLVSMLISDVSEVKFHGSAEAEVDAEVSFSENAEAEVLVFISADAEDIFLHSYSTLQSLQHR